MNSRFRVSAWFLASLIGPLGCWTGWVYLVQFESLSNSPSWGRVVVATLPPVLGAATLSMVVLGVAGKGRPLAPTPARCVMCAAMLILGYLIARDGLSYSLYLSRPGGLSGGCYTDLEVWLRVPHQDSLVRGLEQALGTSLFFSAPLALLLSGQRA